MNLNGAQKKVKQFIDSHGLKVGLEQNILDLSSEVGELAKALLRASSYGQCKPTEFAALRDELGDVLYSALSIADALGADADELLQRALTKYERRLARGATPDSSNEG